MSSSSLLPQQSYPNNTVYVIAGFTPFGDRTTDGNLYLSLEAAQQAAQNIIFPTFEKNMTAPGEVVTLQEFIYRLL